MKRKVALVLLCALLLSCAAFFAACGGTTTSHTHSFTNYVSDNNATCTEDGTKTAKCDGCEKTDTIADPGTAKGHNFSAEWTIDKEATCTEAGLKSHHCTRCEAKMDEMEIPRLSHNDVNGVCSVCGEIIKYTATFKADGKVIGVVEFTVEDKSITAPAVPEKAGYIGEWEDYTLGTKDIIVNAVYTKYYVLTFDYDGATGGNTITEKRVFNGVAIGELPTPTKEDDKYDYWFAGWKVGSVTITEDTIWNEESDAVATACWEKASKGLYYDLNDDGKSYTVFKGDCTDTEVIIPAVYNDLPVTSVGNDAFYNYRNLTSVIIPDSVTSVGNSAFLSCLNLTSVTIGRGVASIRERAFGNCQKLVEVINNSSLNITKESSENGDVAYYALNVKKGGTSDVINKDGYLFYTYENVNYLLGYTGTETELTLLGDFNGRSYEIYTFAFYFRNSLTSVIFSDAVAVIGEGAFLNCSNLTSVTIGRGVTSIENYVFEACSSLTSVTYMGTMAEWSSITKGENWNFTLPSEFVVHCSDGDLPRKVYHIEYEADGGTHSNPDTYTENEEIVLTEARKEGYVFAGWYTDAGFTNKVETLRDITQDLTLYAKYELQIYTATFKADGAIVGTVRFTVESGRLDEPAVPEKPGYAGEWEEYTIRAEDIIVNAVYTKYYVLTFDYNGATGGNTVTEKRIFCGSAIGELPTPVKKEDNEYAYSFVGWQIDSATITEDTIWNEEASATATARWEKYSKGLKFKLNTDNESYSVSNGDCVSVDVIVPSVYNDLPVTALADWAFAERGDLRSVVIPDSVTSVGDGAFIRCFRLTSAVIPDKVTSVGFAAFSCCSSLTSVTIGSSVASIGNGAFDSCYTLVEVIDKSSLNLTKGSRDYGDVAYQALNVKKSGTSDVVNQDDYLFYSYENVIYLVGYAGLDTDLTLPTDHNGKSYEIYQCVFDYRSDLTSVIISEGVTAIPAHAFRSCYNLTSITIPKSVSSIENGALESCKSLATIRYMGTVAEWGSIAKTAKQWYSSVLSECVHCTDGDASI